MPADPTHDHPPPSTAGPTTVTDKHTTRPGTDAPPAAPGYVVTGEIARGGMGRVLAGRELTLDREVALKVLLPRADPVRFVTEARITARLPHPNIPPVYALGELADGAPFLAMKLVRGRTLADLLSARPEPAGGLPEFVRAFEGVCQAVGFAHSRGVIHRDLKPANVMVGEFGEVQVMDWGLAKELVSREAESSEPSADAFWEGIESTGQHPDARTRVGSVLGTPAYMAPEQARGEPVDARADVFALGGILTAVLTNRPVFVAGSVLDTVRRAAAGDTADALARLADCGADAELVGLARDCLAVDPAGRPPDGRAVAERVAAYRTGVEDRLRQAERDRAAADAREAEGRKRRRVVRAGVGLVAAVLVAGIGATSWQAWRAGQARDEAEDGRRQEAAARGREQTARELADRRNAAAVAAKDFLKSVLVQGDGEEQATAGRVPDPRLPLRAALDFAARDIPGRFAGQPEIAADLHDTIGLAYSHLGLYPAARTHLADALRLREAALGPDHPDTLLSVNNLGATLDAAGDPGAEAVLRRAVAGRTAALGPDHPHTLTSVGNLAGSLGRRDAAEADRLARRAEAGLAAALGADHPETLKFAVNRAVRRLNAGDLGAAAVAFRQAAGRLEAVHGPHHPLTLVALSNLATTVEQQGDRAEAVRLHRRVVAGFEAVYGPTHPRALVGAGKLATLLSDAGEAAEAVPLARRAAAGLEAALGADHPHARAAWNNLGLALQTAGDLAAAEPVLRRALADDERVDGPSHPSTLTTVNNLGLVLYAKEEHAAAEPLYRRAVAGRQAELGPDHQDTLSSVGNLAVLLADTGRAAEALPLLQRVVDATERRLGPDHPDTVTHLNNLVVTLARLGRFDAAAAPARRVAEAAERRQFRDANATAHVANLVSVLRRLGRVDEIAVWQRKLVAVADERGGPGSAAAAAERVQLGLSLLALEEWAEAEAVLRAALAAREKAAAGPKPTAAAWQVANTRSLLGEAVGGRWRHAEAEPLLLAGYRGLVADAQAIPAAGRKNLPEAADRLIKLYVAWGKPTEAAKWRAERAKYPAEAAPQPRPAG